MHLDLSKITCDVQLTDTEMSVLEFLLTHIDDALKLGVRGVAKANYTSTSTVMRLAKKLGYNGFIEMYYKLLGEAGTTQDGYELNESFVCYFTGNNSLTPELYQNLRMAARKIYETNQLVFIYGMGFSSLMAEYLAKKLLVLGTKCIYSDAADSIGIFENNLEDIGVLIVFSRSGRSSHVLNRVRTARENSISTIAFTSQQQNPLKEESSFSICIEDDNHLDDRNMKPTTFFARTLTMIELLVYEYYSISLKESR